MIRADRLRIGPLMKGFGMLVIAALAGVAGYVFEPTLRPMLIPGAQMPAARIVPAHPVERTPSVAPTPTVAIPMEEPKAGPTPVATKPSVPTTQVDPMDLAPVSSVAPVEPSVPSALPQTEPEENSATVDAMKRSFQNDGIQEFTKAKPTNWRPGEDETIGGITYQTGVLDYQAETIFGYTTAQATALIRDGKVAKWMSVGTGKQLK